MTDQSSPLPPNAHTHPTGFAPVDLTDGREEGDWESRYPEREARWTIRGEAAYLSIHLLVLVPISLSALFLHDHVSCIGLEPARYSVFKLYAAAWLMGTLGGTLFATKWLYHSVAKWTWNKDRIWWRLLTPHLSGGLAFSFYVVLSSGLVKIIDESTVSKPIVAMAVSFLVGYFSDSAIAKLTEIAETVFGPARKSGQKQLPSKQKKKEPGTSKN
jgi:hypothetical protein